MDDQRESRLQKLSRADCVELLRSSKLNLGRIGYVVDGVPVIVPVSYAVDGESVLFVTARGSKLSWLSNHTRVAFQVDHGHPLDESGWSVLVHGAAQEVTDSAELELLRRGPLHSWAVASGEHWVRISLDEVSGRRLARRIGVAGSEVELDD
jgi:nitroimidazol reductase NimA-like FMN-containing flavoprotein (pyridoxamine 5'-phosphate oxidase superfamily)